MNGLPKWVYDLVIALQQHEDEHGDNTSCLAPVLRLVPADVGREADAIRRYAAQAREDALMAKAQEHWAGLAEGLTAKKQEAP